MKWIGGRFAAVLSLAACVCASGQSTWQFEFEDGLPVNLVWQTIPGRTYNLRQATDLPFWASAPGFPKIATGPTLEYPFAPGPQGFFQITEETETGGGWQLTQLPALPPGNTFSFSAVSALDSHQLWISGAISPGGDACVLRSIDGGSAWTLPYRAGGVGFFGDLRMVSPNVGFAAGSGLRRTTDGGSTWEFEQSNIPDPPGTWHNVGPDGYVYGMAVVDQEHLWTAGYDGYSAGVIYHRVPERPQPDPEHPSGNTPWWLEWAMNYRGMYGVGAVDQNTAWAVGYAGFIWKTTDGQSWSQQNSGTGVPLQDVQAVDSNTAWVVGDGGTILRTGDGGTTWVPQTSGTTENLRRISAVSASVAWAVGSGGVILHTRDGGITWRRQFSGTTATFQGLAAVDADTAWVAGDGGVVLRTSDGGRGNWPPPLATGVSPTLVGAESQPPMTVTITGSGFRGGNLQVAFGDTPSESVTWINESTVQAAAPYHAAGTSDITVTNEDGRKAMLPRAVTFVPSPIIQRFSPFHGPARGGFQITIDGFNLQTVDQVQLYNGTYELLDFNIIDSTHLVVSISESMTREPGMASLLVHTAQNQWASARDFLLDPPEGSSFAVDSVAPDAGERLTTITITGVGFTPTTTVDICGSPLKIADRSATRLVGQVQGNPGLCYLTVINDENNYRTLDPGFQLTSGPAPVISQVTPASGPAIGETSTTLIGTGFQPTDTVTFDGYPADVTERSATALVVTIPAHVAGPVSVIVMTENLRRAAAILPNGFTYHP